MILCYEHIKEAFGGLGEWSAFRDGERIYSRDLKISSNSVDVTLGNIALRRPAASRHQFIDPEKPETVEWESEVFEELRLLPGDFVLAHVRESFDCSAPLVLTGYDNRARRFIPMIDGRSTFARCGLSIHQTAGYGDFNFGAVGPNGEAGAAFTLELSTKEPIILRPGYRIAQVSFEEGSSGSKRYSGAYVDQSEGPRAPVLGVGRV